ncbi:MAG: GNAT family N-acetyltransferase [Deltaproteobacteria bacterium]|nr:GNAT family N-acetyltransferase [Deltaproteobacteria bacterium]
MEKSIEIETESGKFFIRRFREDDEKKILKLWELVFGQEMNQELWRWKYFDNPYSQALLLCESDKKEVLALYGGIPFKGLRKGEDVVIVQLMDIMSHPDFRGKGLFARTGKTFCETFCNKKSAEILYGFPGKFHFDLGKRILGYAPLQSRVAYLKGETDVLASKNRTSLSSIKRVENPGEEFDRLWEKCRIDYPYAVVRNAEFLHWRFCRHPERRYEIFCLKDVFSREIQGYAVLYFKEDAAILVDMLFPKSEKRIALFFGKIGYMLKSRNVLQVQTWLPGSHFLKKAAITAGFEEHDEPLGIISTIKSFDHSPDTEWIDNNFYYSMADADLF